MRKVQPSFSAGEYDPALRERSNLEKYQSGLATARNCIIGKTGRIVSRPGQKYLKSGKLVDKKVILFPVLHLFKVLEIGDSYVRVWSQDFSAYQESTSPYEENDLPYLQLTVKKYQVWFAREAQEMRVFNIASAPFFESAFAYAIRVLSAPFNTGTTISGTGTGYAIDYAFSFILPDGTETTHEEHINAATFKMPIAISEKNELKVRCEVLPVDASEMKVFRRPNKGGAYGYIGSSFDLQTAGPQKFFEFIDLGQSADYTQTPIDYANDFVNDVPEFYNPTPKAVLFYQQSLIMSGITNREITHKSRTGLPTNWTRDYPLTSTSGLTLKAGTDQQAKVLRYLDAGPLVVFTDKGIYANEVGPLVFSNSALTRKGDWVIDELLPPLIIPGAILFVDSLTNSVNAIQYSDTTLSFQGEEISIYSAHLLEGKRIVSWTFRNGDIPYVVCVMDDGTLMYLTYQKEQLMRAWTRGDSRGGFYEWVIAVDQTVYNESTGFYDLTGKKDVIFVVNRGGVRMFEQETDRYGYGAIRNYIGLDAAVTYKSPVTFIGMDTLPHLGYITATPVTANVWDGPLNLYSDEWVFQGIVDGVVLRFYAADQSYMDLELTNVADNQNATAEPLDGRLFPSDQAVNFNLYKISPTVSGLTHLNGKQVAVISDGFILSNPLNDEEEYPVVTVSGGSITLPAGAKGGIIHVGIPYAVDVETLDVTTVEQKPVTLESKICDRVYVQLYNSRTIYAGQEFAENDLVGTMERAESRHEDEDEMSGQNAPQVPWTRREEISTTGDWKSNGRVCLRTVDPLPTEILSIIPDLDVFFKGE